LYGKINANTAFLSDTNATISFRFFQKLISYFSGNHNKLFLSRQKGFFLTRSFCRGTFPTDHFSLILAEKQEKQENRKNSFSLFFYNRL
jgi:hypothetical protein